jgi:hypothetical protein
MYTDEKLLQMISSEKASKRYDACEWIRVSQKSSPEIITALQKASQDPDKEVAERAKLALEADIHHQMAVKLGFAQPTENELNQTEISTPEGVESDETGREFSALEQQSFDYLQIGQAITFILGVVVLIFLWLTGRNILSLGKYALIIIGIYLVYIVLQIYAIFKYGFENSFNFLKEIAILMINSK